MRMSSQKGPVTIGIQFRRREPVSGEKAIWTAQPPATFLYDTNFFGHLEDLVDIRPDQHRHPPGPHESGRGSSEMILLRCD